MSRGTARRTPAGDAKGYLGKAVAYYEAAKQGCEAGLWSPAVGNAVHAGILAADAISALKLGQVWKGDGHTGAVDHVRKAGSEGKRAAIQLQRLVAMKTRAEYDPVPNTSQEAAQALKASSRIVELAGRVVEGVQ